MDFFETTHDSTRRANIMSVNPIFFPNIQKRILLKKNTSFPLDVTKIALLLQRF